MSRRCRGCGQPARQPHELGCIVASKRAPANLLNAESLVVLRGGPCPLPLPPASQRADLLEKGGDA